MKNDKIRIYNVSLNNNANKEKGEKKYNIHVLGLDGLYKHILKNYIMIKNLMVMTVNS